MERFLYRLSHSQYKEKFVLKGALILRVHEISRARSTKDIDLLGYMNNSVHVLVEIFKTCCEVVVSEDGLQFDTMSVKGNEIVEEADYHGVRITLHGVLGTAKVFLHIDVGFGDIIEPGAEWIDYPELLDFGKPSLQAYTLESIIAEKFQTMVKLDFANSRMKDFYDIWFLANNYVFDSERLMKAIASTFGKRATEIPHEIPTAFMERFATDDGKKKQWLSFCRKISVDSIPFIETISQIKDFLMSPVEAYNSSTLFQKQWMDGRWKAR